MTDDQLKAYARVGLTARLAELEREQASLRALLASIGDVADPVSERGLELGSEKRPRTMSDDGRRRIGDAARRRWAAVRAASGVVVDVVVPTTPDVEAARVLPRRGRLARQVVGTVHTLPPMPRLVKAGAS